METVTGLRYSYDVNAFRQVLEEILGNNGAIDLVNTLKQSSLSITALNTAFATASRKAGKNLVTIGDAQRKSLQEIVPGWMPDHSPADKLLRTWLLVYYAPADFEAYQHSVENLFRAAAVNELCALYAALPLLPNAAAWKQRCAEGIRSNIGDVLEAIMYDNSYPSTHLDESAWNQLVLKALFTGKDLNRIIGLDKRANKELAIVLHDFAHERWAAHRQAPPQLWRLAAPFINENSLVDFQLALENPDIATRQAAALALWGAPGTMAKELLSKYPDLKQAASSGTIQWSQF